MQQQHVLTGTRGRRTTIRVGTRSGRLAKCVLWVIAEVGA